MPRTRLSTQYPDKGVPKSEPLQEPVKNKSPEYKRVPGTPFVFDVDTGAVYLDKAIYDMLK